MCHFSGSAIGSYLKREPRAHNPTKSDFLRVASAPVGLPSGSDPVSFFVPFVGGFSGLQHRNRRYRAFPSRLPCFLALAALPDRPAPSSPQCTRWVSTFLHHFEHLPTVPLIVRQCLEAEGRQNLNQRLCVLRLRGRGTGMGNNRVCRRRKGYVAC